MRLYLAGLFSLGLTIGCGTEPSATLKNPVETRDVKASNQSRSSDQTEQVSASNSSRAVTGNIASGEISYHIEVQTRDSGETFVLLEVFDASTEENIDLDVIPQVSHVHIDGCCQPTPPAVTELSKGHIEIGALDLHGEGIQKIGFVVTIDGSTYNFQYDYDYEKKNSNSSP